MLTLKYSGQIIRSVSLRSRQCSTALRLYSSSELRFDEGRGSGSTEISYTKETTKIPSRNEIVKRLKSGDEFDVLVIGGGATGAGAALDAAQRGLKVACVEREDFASGTSSRSTKLLWGGSRYLVQAFVSLLSPSLITSPITTVKNFIEEFRLVMNCHRERRFLLTTQPHLTQWLPIAVPLDKWFIWPPPFNFYPAALGALGLFPLFFQFVSLALPSSSQL